MPMFEELLLQTMVSQNLTNELTRRSTLQAFSVGVVGAFRLPGFSTSVTVQSVGDLIFTDDFEDGTFDWTDVDHPEFWTETSGKVRYSPLTSAGSTGDNLAYADATFEGNQGVLEWPVAIEFRAYASDTSSAVGAHATSGGPKDNRGTPRLGIEDSAYTGTPGFRVWNSTGQAIRVGERRDNNKWYTYRLVPDLDNEVVRVSRNNETWIIPEPGDNPIGNTSIALSGHTCWGCGGNGDRRYEYIKVWDIPLRIEVDIDVKPCSDPNAVNPDAEGVIPVGIKHTDEFDPVEQINEGSLRFGAPDVVKNGRGAMPVREGRVEDAVPCAGDGRDDLVVHFPTDETGFEGGDNTGRLEGETNDGTPLFGTDSVKLVGR